MLGIPENPKIYHITHIDNLEGILKYGVLWSDAKRHEMGLDCEIVGIPEIKRRRLEELEVNCHPGTKVGGYVPFYFCPRSIMLYIIYRGNHQDIKFRQGQNNIIHLQADLISTIEWADKNKIRWSFSDRNAGAYFAKFYNTIDDLNKINWAAVESTDFRGMLVKEGKQAEFLVYESFPWHLVEKIGVQNDDIRKRVIEKIGDARAGMVTVEQSWYY
jgi:hypothetical protein